MKPIPRTIFSNFCIMAVAVFALVAISCTANRKPVAVGSSAPRPDAGYSEADDIEKQLLKEYRQWRGTRHRMGASGREGIDCSGFVQEVYRDVFNLELPRTTGEQVKLGKPVPFKELQAGDLVFFKPPTYPRHVGIFLSQSEFVHASKQKGVTVSRITAQYWGKYYWTARRILMEPETR